MSSCSGARPGVGVEDDSPGSPTPPARCRCPGRLLPDPLPELPVDVETALFRIADEALHNVVRHAQARACTVELRSTPGEVELVVRDDGAGIAAEPRAGGVGLGSMRARAARVGGRLVVEPGAPGTVVRAVVPISVPAGAAE
jgi:signal transduction histidine kinase